MENCLFSVETMRRIVFLSTYRRYLATKATHHSGQDSRLSTLQRILYESSSTAEATGFSPSPDPDLDLEFKQYCMRRDAEFRADLQKKINCIHQAHHRLKELDERLFQGATRYDPAPLFPRRWRAPTETLSSPDKQWRVSLSSASSTQSPK